MSIRPTDDQFTTAIMWLEANEGVEPGEREACLAVAQWLDAHCQDAMFRSKARKAGIPVAKLRDRLARAGLARAKGAS